MLLLLLACKTPTLAGYTMTADGHYNTADPNYTAYHNYRMVRTYDADENVVAETYNWDYGLGELRILESRTSWDDGCPVRDEEVDASHGWENATTRLTTCDTRGDPVQVESQFQQTDIDGNVTRDPEQLEVYTNTHDRYGRLVQAIHAYGEEEEQQQEVYTYGWGDCEEPTYSSYRYAWSSSVTTLSCRDDGQTEEILSFYFEEDGSVSGATRTFNSYDLEERLVGRLEESDFGGSTYSTHYQWYWGDANLPGPIMRLVFVNDALQLTSLYTYTLAE